MKELLPHVYLLPQVLTGDEAERLLHLRDSVACHHGDEDGHHVRQTKPLMLPWIANILWLDLEEHIMAIEPQACCIDEWMRLYRLPEGAGMVHPHRDKDFVADNGLVATHSILLYLSDDYEGGETVFEEKVAAPHLPRGAGLLFRHDVLHEGFVVRRGEKFVLKTDLCFKH